MIYDVHPGSRFRVRIFFHLGSRIRIPDPEVKKAPDPGSQIRIRNTAFWACWIRIRNHRVVFGSDLFSQPSFAPVASFPFIWAGAVSLPERILRSDDVSSCKIIPSLIRLIEGKYNRSCLLPFWSVNIYRHAKVYQCSRSGAYVSGGPVPYPMDP